MDCILCGASAGMLEAVVIWGNELETLAISNGLEKIRIYVLGMKMVHFIN